MSVTISVFEKDGKKFPTIALRHAKDDKFAFTFGLGKARLIVEHIDSIKQFVLDNAVEEAKAEVKAEANGKADKKTGKK